MVLKKVLLVLSASLFSMHAVDARRGFVDRHRILQDVTLNEEEVGGMGHEQAVSIAGEKDSTTAKATSSVHVPHKDASTKDEHSTNIEETWSENDIKVAEQLNHKNVTTNVQPTSNMDEDQEYSEYTEEPEELSEEDLELKRIEEENLKIEQGFEEYSNADAALETAKLQEKEMAKNKKKAVSIYI